MRFTDSKDIRRGRFQHPAILSGIEKLYFNKGKTTALGNLEPCEGIAALRGNLTAESVAWVCLGVFSQVRSFLTEVILGTYRAEKLSDIYRGRVQTSHDGIRLESYCGGAKEEAEDDDGYCIYRPV